MHEQSENFNKERIFEKFQTEITELKNTITELNNSIERFNSRLNEEERIRKQTQNSGTHPLSAAKSERNEKG